jgi:hypothetical protein
VGSPSSPPEATPDFAAVPAPSTTTALVVSVKRLARRLDVYDIAVEGAHEFFANGILVHNCDELAAYRYPAALDNLLLGLRLGADPRPCVSTTPRAVRLVTALVGDPTPATTRDTTYANRAHLAAGFFERVVTKFEGTRLGRQELHAEILLVGEGAWFAGFDPARHVTAEAEWDRRFPVHLAIDCGLSRHVGAVWLQFRSTYEGAAKACVTVFGDYHGEGLYSEANARAILQHGQALTGGGRPDVVRLDPASTARSGVGPVAYGEFAAVFGDRSCGRWPQHRVAEGLDQVELLLDHGLLRIHPRCTRLIAALQNYTRRRGPGGEYEDRPEDPQHPHEDLVDALRGGIRDKFPEGRVEGPHLRRVPAHRLV